MNVLRHVVILLGLRVASRTAEQVENREKKVTGRCTGTHILRQEFDRPGFRKEEFNTERNWPREEALWQAIAGVLLNQYQVRTQFIIRAV